MLCWWGQLIPTIIKYVRSACCVCVVVPCALKVLFVLRVLVESACCCFVGVGSIFLL